MKLFDAHNHIQDERLFRNLDSVMERADLAGVVKMAVKGCSEEDWPRVVEVINRYPNACYPAFGLHPWFVFERSSLYLQRLEELLTTYPQASVGEIGIDHAVEKRDDAVQEHVFLEQLQLAWEYRRPVTIHCRRAWGRLIELLDQFGPFPYGLLIHCFGGSAEVATELVKRGAYISFSGSITRPNARKAGPAIRAVPLNRLLIETDAPDIFPHNCATEPSLVLDLIPLNEPGYLGCTLRKAAELLAMTEQKLAEVTLRNAERFFFFWE